MVSPASPNALDVLARPGGTAELAARHQSRAVATPAIGPTARRRRKPPRLAILAKKVHFRVAPQLWRSIRNRIAGRRGVDDFKDLLTGPFTALAPELQAELLAAAKEMVPDSIPGAVVFRDALLKAHISNQYAEKKRQQCPDKILRRRKQGFAHSKNRALTYRVTLELQRDFPGLQQDSDEYAQRFSEAIATDLIRDPAALPDAPHFFY